MILKSIPRLSPAVFLDKDGTLIEDVPYNVDPSLIRFTEGAIAGLRLLQAARYLLIVVTNQSGVARGYFPQAALKGVEQEMRSQLAQAGISLQGFYSCPHHPDGVISPHNVLCNCRKPQPGLLYRAAKEHSITLKYSWMIGDILNDIEAGHKADCQTILIDNGNETEWQISPQRSPHFTVKNFYEAAQIILSHSRYPVMEKPHVL
jgi:D-glycero-D-manno-heptose 1,7-bisphosphate phosphatase